MSGVQNVVALRLATRVTGLLATSAKAFVCWFLVSALLVVGWFVREQTQQIQQQLQVGTARLLQGGSNLWQCDDFEALHTNALKLLGSGGSKDVMSTRWRGREVAIKRFRYLSFDAVLHPIESYRAFSREALNFARFHSDHAREAVTPAFMGACLHPLHLWIAVERCECTVASHFKNHGVGICSKSVKGKSKHHCLSWDERLQVTIGIALALERLEDQAPGLVLCDFHLKQLLVCGSESNKTSVKLGDADSLQRSRVSQHSKCATDYDCIQCGSQAGNIFNEFALYESRRAIPKEFQCNTAGHCIGIGPALNVFRLGYLLRQLLPLALLSNCTQTRIMQLIESCTDLSPAARPSMKHVRTALESEAEAALRQLPR